VINVPIVEQVNPERITEKFAKWFWVSMVLVALVVAKKTANTFN
jgi:hypothetical protein